MNRRFLVLSSGFALASSLSAFLFAAPAEARKENPIPRPPITIQVPADQPTIQAGIDAARDGDTVLVADGVYTGVGNRDIDFKGKKIRVRSENGAAATIVDCEGFGRGFRMTSGETNASKLIGFTVENGLHQSEGGGIYCVSTSPAVSRCVVRNNAAPNGAGVFVSGGAPIITSCLIVDNSGALPIGGFRRGGGVYCSQSDLVIRNSTVANNTAFDSGGGIYASGGTTDLTISNCILWGNNTQNGFFLDQLTLLVQATADVTFSDVEGGEAGVNLGTGTLNWGAGNFDLFPRFLDETGGDYHLRNDSPCIEAGDPGYVPPGAGAVDIDGDPRVFGTFVDVGADEFGSCSSVFRQYFSTSVPLPIPDDEIAGLQTTINVPEFGIVNGPVGFFVDVDHPDPSEILLVLYPPGCGPGDACGIILCGLLGSCPFPAFFTTGSFFFGTQINGDWTLQLIDRDPGNVGTLLDWRLDQLFTLCP